MQNTALKSGTTIDSEKNDSKENTQHKRYLITGGFTYTANEATAYIENSWLLICGENIISMGVQEIDALPEHDELINAKGKMILPGLVNPHWHESFIAPNFETADDKNLKVEPYAQGGDIEALGSMFGFISNIGNKLSYQEALAIARWSLWTQLRSGTTALGDIGSVNLPNALAQAAIDLGIRLRVSRWGSDIMIPNEGNQVVSIADTDQQTADWQALMETWNNHSSGLIDGMPSVVGAFGSSDKQLIAMRDIAETFHSPYAAHLAPLRNEAAAIQRVFGETAIGRFNKLGLLTNKLIAVHTSYTSADELDCIIKNGVNICFSPAHYGMSGESTLSETGQMADLLKRGVPIACSTDGDISYIGGMPEAMRAIHLGLNEASNDNTTCSPNTALLTATQNAANMLGWGERIGSLEPGKQADLVFVDIDDFRYCNTNHPLRTFLISGSSKDVDSVMIKGKMLVKHGKSEHFNEAELFNDFKLAVASARLRIKPSH